MNHPLALIVYNRPEHIRRVLEALRLQQPKPLYVFCDGPKDAEDSLKVNEARAHVGSLIDWTGLVMLMRNKNIGLARNIVGAVDKVLAQHETAIVLEDDCLPGPWFYEFMCECLDRYAETDGIIAATGYTPFAVDWEWDVWFSPRIETWGWGTWRRGWALYERNVAEAHRRAIEKGIDLEQGGSDVPGYIRQAMEGKDVWSAGWLLASYLNGGLCVYPTRSHVQNIGLDGSGVHCGVKMDTAPLAAGPSRRFFDGWIRDAEIDAKVRAYYG